MLSPTNPQPLELAPEFKKSTSLFSHLCSGKETQSSKRLIEILHECYLDSIFSSWHVQSPVPQPQNMQDQKKELWVESLLVNFLNPWSTFFDALERGQEGVMGSQLVHIEDIKKPVVSHILASVLPIRRGQGPYSVPGDRRQSSRGGTQEEG